MKSKMRNRILALLLAVAMVMNGGISALANEEATTETTVVGDEASHVHTDECYTNVKVSEDVICGKDVVEGHAHGDACYNVSSQLVCELAEAEIS